MLMSTNFLKVFASLYANNASIRRFIGDLIVSLVLIIVLIEKIAFDFIGVFTLTILLITREAR